jgi:hypothetical protein
MLSPFRQWTKLTREAGAEPSLSPHQSPISNAYIDFSKMTCSVVAIIADVVSDGKLVPGYGFNSNGRYGQGCLTRERFRSRILEADPKALIVVKYKVLGA